MNFNKKIFILLVPALAIVFSLAVYFGAKKVWPEFTPDAAASDGGKVIYFTIKTFEGPRLKIKELTGKPLVINFWGSWCGPCRSEAPDLESAYKDFKGKVHFVGVAVQDSDHGAREFVRDYKITYPNGLDRDDSIMGLYKVYGVPMTVVYDSFGKMHYRHVGGITRSLLSRKLKELL